MGTFKSLEEAREYFKNDRFATGNGMVIDELFDGGCVCSAEIRDEHRNALGIVMGGVIFTLADFAFAVSSNNAHSPTVGLEAKINYLNASKGSRLTARSTCVKQGRTTCVYCVKVTDDLGADVALFTGTGCVL